MIEIGPNLAHLLADVLTGVGMFAVLFAFGYVFLKIGGFTKKW